MTTTLTSSPPVETRTRRRDAVVVGTGFTGVAMLYHLVRDGLDVEALESADSVGGTWYHNRYPGARCDIESLDYSYSFDDDLQQEWRWPERYSPQPDILRYINHVVDRFDLRGHIRLDSRVTRATYRPEDGRWTVLTEDGYEVDTKYLLLATGVLNAAQRADIPGLDSFAGQVIHTADWPHDGVDLTGRRVGVIGTGSSGTQLIPIVAEDADHLTVFQRTANFVMPARNHAISDETDEEWKSTYPERREYARTSYAGHNQTPAATAGADVSAAERAAEFERRWQIGGLYMMRAFTDLLTDPVVNAEAAEFVRDKIRQTVTDPAVAEILCPRQDLPFGTKRLCSGTRYYETYNRPDVELVDVRAEPILEVTPDGLRTSRRTVDLDVLVLATGFDAMTGSFRRLDVRGTDGRSLAEHWSAGPRTFMGTGTSGFPNMFVLAGPQSPSVFSNMVTSAEVHVEWVRDLIRHAETTGAQRIETSAEAEDAWVEHVTGLAASTLYQDSRDTWFWGANTPGKARVFMPYLGGLRDFSDRLDAVADADYEGFELR